jgi:hypothetical protein
LLTEAERSPVGERSKRKLCLAAKWWVHVQGNGVSKQWRFSPSNHNGKYMYKPTTYFNTKNDSSCWCPVVKPQVVLRGICNAWSGTGIVLSPSTSTYSC